MQTSSPQEASCDLTLPLNSSDPASYLRQLCSAGYFGPVCSLCVKTDDKRYGRAGPLQCQECKSNAVILLAYIISTLLVLAWLSYTVHVTLEENEEAAAGSTDPGRTSQLIRVCPPAEGHDQIRAYAVTPRLPACIWQQAQCPVNVNVWCCRLSALSKQDCNLQLVQFSLKLTLMTCVA